MVRMNRFIITLCMAMGFFLCHAQNSKKNKEDFDAFRTELHKDFESFRAKIMREYIQFVKDPWKDFESVAPVPKPKKEPIPPVVIPDDAKDTTRVESNPIIIEEVIKPLPVTPQPQPIEEIPENDSSKDKYVNVLFFGTSLKVRFNENDGYHIGTISEKNVANALTVLAQDIYDNSILDCLKIRDEYSLCDWAYLLFIQKFTNEVCGKDSNEATLLAAYILLQSGYQVRFAFFGDKLYVLYASKHSIFNKNSYSIDGQNYYGLVELPSRLMISQASFPNEQGISLLINNQPRFSVDLSPNRIITSKAYPSFKVGTQTNKNLLSFYETYPCSYYNDNYMTQWAQYANTPIDPQVESSVYPVLRKMLEGLNEKEKVSRLLNWVQTGLTYEYDDKIWGRDRTFFSEESLYYPYCDCEDRSVLLTRLVRDIVGLECILVYYPGHLAVAVNFTVPINGDYISLDSKRFVVCDPTYIGSSVGMTMPGMNNSKAGVIILK